MPRVLEPAGEEALAGGLYDSGVLGWGPRGDRVLAWWRERVEERLREERGGPHVLDAAPALFDEVMVVRDPALRRRGVEPARGRALGGARRETLRRGGAERRAQAAAGALANGTAVDGALRDVIRATPPSAGIELGDLDTAEGTHRLLEWANGPADRGAVQGVTRYLLALHGRRLDLHDAFRALEDDDGEAFVQWARTTGRADGIPDVLLPLPAPESAPARRAAAARRQRRRLPAHRDRRRRGGAAVRRGARGSARCRCARRPPTPGCRSPSARSFQDRRPAVEYPFNLVCVNAVRAAGVRAPHRRGLLRGPRDDRPLGVGGVDGARLVGRGVLAASTRSGPTPTTSRACSPPASPVPVVTRAAAGAAPARRRAAARPRARADAFTFLFTFDFFSTTRRKNPVGLVQAYTRAFGPEDGTQLVIKTFNGDAKPESLRELLQRGRRPARRPRDRPLPAASRRRTRCSRGRTATSRCTAPRASGSRSPRRCCSASRWSRRATRATSSS